MIDSKDRLYLGGDSLERDKFSSAILGINAKDNTIVYSVDKIIEIFVLEDDMTAEEANEYFEFNVLGSYMGEGTPTYMFDVDGYFGARYMEEY